MKRLSIFSLCLALGFISCNLLNAQETPLKVFYNPKSPETSSLFDFTDVAVGNYTGSTNVNVPFTVLSDGPLSTAISLSYNSSGSKVSQRATWVGLGWNLNAGGMISREVRGLADDAEIGMGFLKFIDNYSFTSVNDILSLADPIKFTLYDQLSSFRCQDSEPDLFTFNVGGLSGSFMFDWDGSLKVACNKSIRVDYTQFPDSNEIAEWEIIDDQGNIYVFSKRETNDITNVLGMGGLGCTNNPYTSSWKLTSMEDPSGQHTINFTYEDYSLDYPVEYSKQHTISLGGAHINYTFGQSAFEIEGSYIKTITSNNTQYEIEFLTDLQNPRTDVTGTNLYPLGTIKVKNNHDDVVEEYDLDYDLNNRLKLNTIKRVTPSETIDLYEFEYDATSLPNYSSYSTDHWGYYNGANNGEPYPSFVFLDFPNQELTVFPGADKRPNASFSEAGILKKITYPTKGYTEFVYENHDYSFIQSSQIPLSYEQIPITEGSSVIGNAPPNTSTWVTDEEYFVVDINTTTSDENTWCSSGYCVRKVEIDVEAVNLFAFATGVNSPKYYIYDSSNNLVKSLSLVPYDADYCNGGSYLENDEIWLEDGTYRLVTETKNIEVLSCPVNNYINVTLSYNNDTTNSIFNAQAGGLRIKEISNYDYNDDLITKRAFEYILNDTPNLSSGSIPVLPKYEDIHYYWSNPGPSEEWVRYSGSLLQLGSSIGHVKYSEVTVNLTNSLNSQNLKTVYKYSLGEDDLISLQKPYSPPISHRPYKKGVLTKQIVYENTGNVFTPVSETTFTYDFSQISVRALKVSRAITGNCQCSDPGIFAVGDYHTSIGHSQPVSRNVKTFFGQNTAEQDSATLYDSSLQRVISSSADTSENETILTELTYPDTDLVSPINTDMITKNIIATPVKKEVSKNGILAFTENFLFKNWGNYNIQLEKIKTAKASDPLEERLIHYQYDNLGNPLEVAKKSGARISYIWGYHSSLPIAMIENLSYNQIPSSTISNLQSLSDLDDDDCYAGGSCEENNLRNALNSLRSQFPQAMITTYTYNPLIGLTSITDPKGYTAYYVYDNQNRLEYLMDQDGKIMGKKEYNLKN